MVETIVPPLVKDGIPVNPKEAEEIVGFKTIRLLLDNRMKDVPKIAAFLKTHFPCTRYIINRRSNLTEQAQSQKNHFFSVESMNLEAVTDKLEQETQRLLRLAELLGTERATILDSSAWLKNVEVLNQAVRWLGFSESCAFHEIMELNTAGFDNGNTTITPLDPQCQYVGK
jgi:hypothetical protein